ncbi:ABC transporter ATP-binding protein [Catenulispora sp. NF23]|uniref:ABC transporter ATP-binding protein n=1 Tax=Catenulispora pinistramenti TaxID=2705254 RepID=A0ABS5L4F1_9ACTN|nr:ABC transporter ATP-binding protein [Catenulispora pinistramenti]MBS2536426.1 ABC transporter ATP-binding protein [Catenulispora pinistramenti]MBS2553105.1 ABC transporter ATP-binding protein [Catenulispora pinistramenti]
MTPVLEAEGLGKRYGRRRALTDCDLSIPPGRVIGLVGPNGAGKSTLLQLACGLIKPTSGTITVLGQRPGTDAAQLAKVGFVAQDTPVYAALSVADHLRMGAHLNPGWDGQLAQRRIAQIGLDPKQRAGRLSGGQRAQLALTVAVAKRPDLLIFDEPAAALDPLARRGFLENLMEFIADLGASAILSSHALSDVQRVCDYLIVLADSRVQVAGEVTQLLERHRRLSGSRNELEVLPPGFEVVHADHTVNGSSVVVRTNRAAAPSGPWQWAEIDLEALVLAYMTRAEAQR